MKASNVAVEALNEIKDSKNEAITSTELTSEPPAKKLKENERPLEILSDKLQTDSSATAEKVPAPSGKFDHLIIIGR